MLCRSLWLMTAPKKEGGGGGGEIPSPAGVLWEPHSCRAYLQITPALTSPTFVTPKKAGTASVYRLSGSKSLIIVLLGLALACLTLKSKPFQLLKGSLVVSLTLEIIPTAVHNSLISFVHAVHSLKRCSRLCLPPLHHQQTSESVHPHSPSKRGYHCVTAQQLEEPGRYPLGIPPQLGADAWSQCRRG